MAEDLYPHGAYRWSMVTTIGDLAKEFAEQMNKENHELHLAQGKRKVPAKDRYKHHAKGLNRGSNVGSKAGVCEECQGEVRSDGKDKVCIECGLIRKRR